MPGRNGSSDGYRYGFNGMENDDEWTGSGSQLDFGARVYDARIGKFLSVDPKAYIFPQQSPYCYAGNNPIAFIDYNGEGPVYYIIHMQITEVNGRNVVYMTVETVVNVKVLNKSSLDISTASGQNLAYALTKKAAEEYKWYTGEYADPTGVLPNGQLAVSKNGAIQGYDVKYKHRVRMNFQYVSSESQIGANDNVLVLVDDAKNSPSTQMLSDGTKVTTFDTQGYGEIRGQFALVEISLAAPDEFYLETMNDQKQTISIKTEGSQISIHELFHNLGLEDCYPGCGTGSVMGFTSTAFNLTYENQTDLAKIAINSIKNYFLNIRIEGNPPSDMRMVRRKFTPGITVDFENENFQNSLESFIRSNTK